MQLNNTKYNFYMKSFRRNKLNTDNVRVLFSLFKYEKDLTDYFALVAAWEVYKYNKDEL